MLRFLLIFVLVIATVGQLVGQSQTDDASAQATTALTTVFKSGSAAERVVSDVRGYKQSTTWDLTTLLRITRKLAVAGFKPAEIMPTLTACGDAAAAVDGEDATLELVVLAMADLRTQGNRSAGVNLYALRNAGVPAFALLGKAIGRSSEQTERLANSNRINGKTAFDALLAMYRLEYHGLAVKLAQEKK
jgi:hypothetical protein